MSAQLSAAPVHKIQLEQEVEQPALSRSASPTPPPSCDISRCPTLVNLEYLGADGYATPKSGDSLETKRLEDRGRLPLSIAPTLVEAPPAAPSISPGKSYLLLIIFCVAQFVDVFNNSALFPALSIMSEDLSMSASDLQWLFSAYQLTFASFLLASGRVADISSPKWTFISGTLLLSAMSLVLGFIPSSIPLLVLRAVQGIGAALTISSSLSLIVYIFPSDPLQSRAIAIYGGVGAIGNVMGLLIGAVLSQYITYKWCFWFVSCIATPAAIAAAFLIPKGTADVSTHTTPTSSSDELTPQKKVRTASLDYLGVSLLTSVMILFVFGLTSGSVVGWTTAQVWVPFVASLFILGGFLFWETKVPEQDAAMPPSMWFFPNFGILFTVALLPYGARLFLPPVHESHSDFISQWWYANLLLFSELWPQYGLSTIEVAIHFLPMGLVVFIITTTLAFLPPFPRPKVIIMIGFAGMLVSGIMLPFARGMDRYWSIFFPAILIGSSGTCLVFVYTNIAIFKTTPESRSGLTGAAFNSALQIGSIIVISGITSITSSVNERQPGDPFNGVSASLWFVLGMTVVETVVVGLFYREDRNLESVKERVPAKELTPEEKA